VRIFFGANKGYEKKVKGCENIRRKFKGYENVLPFSEKHSNRVSGLKKDLPRYARNRRHQVTNRKRPANVRKGKGLLYQNDSGTLVYGDSYVDEKYFSKTTFLYLFLYQ